MEMRGLRALFIITLICGALEIAAAIHWGWL